MKHNVPFQHLFQTEFNAAQLLGKKGRNKIKISPPPSCRYKYSRPMTRPVKRASYLMLQGAVLPLRLLTNDDQVQVVVAGAVTRQAVHMNHVSKQVQFTPGK